MQLSGLQTCTAPDSEEAQIVANSQESGLSQTMTWYYVNKYCEQNGLPSLTKSAVSGAIVRFKPLLVKITKHKQGRTDPKAPGSKASYCWCLQLASWIEVLN